MRIVWSLAVIALLVTLLASIPRYNLKEKAQRLFQGPDTTTVVLGTVELGPDKYLYLRGRRLTGRITGTYRQGISYLNGLPWWQAIKSPQPRTPPAPTRFRSLTPGQDSLFRRIPFVSAEIARGVPPAEAANHFLNRYEATTKAVSDAYTRARRWGLTGWAAQAATKMIDTTVAELPNARMGGKGTAFRQNGFVLAFPGWMAYSYVIEDRGGLGIGRRPKWPSLDDARSEFGQLRKYMTWPEGPAIAIYTNGGGTTMACNSDAVKMTSTIEKLRGLGWRYNLRDLVSSFAVR